MKARETSDMSMQCVRNRSRRSRLQTECCDCIRTSTSKDKSEKQYAGLTECACFCSFWSKSAGVNGRKVVATTRDGLHWASGERRRASETIS